MKVKISPKEQVPAAPFKAGDIVQLKGYPDTLYLVCRDRNCGLVAVSLNSPPVSYEATDTFLSSSSYVLFEGEVILSNG